MKIGVIVAMDKEYEQLKEVAASIQNHEIILAKCGLGKVNAALGAQQMINKHQPDIIISTGCAGGCSQDKQDEVKIQDVIVSKELTYHDVYCGTAVDNCTIYGQVQGLPARYQSDPELVKKALNLRSGIKVHAGLIVTGDWFVDSKEKMRSIVELFPDAKAVDMESCAIAQTCYINHVPFISFRVISDLPLLDEDASQYHDFWNTVADESFHVTKEFIERIINER